MYNYTHSYSWSIEKFLKCVIQRILKADESKFYTSVTLVIILTEVPYHFKPWKVLSIIQSLEQNYI